MKYSNTCYMSNGTGTIILKYLLISILDCATFFFTGIQSLWNCLLVFLWFQWQKASLVWKSIWNGKSKFISCGLPLTINEEIRRFIFADVFVNDNKVLFHSELQEFQKSFLKKLERAMQAQYFTFVDLGRLLYTSEVSYTATANRNYNNRGTYNRTYYHRRKR